MPLDRPDRRFMYICIYIRVYISIMQSGCANECNWTRSIFICILLIRHARIDEVFKRQPL